MRLETLVKPVLNVVNKRRFRSRYSGAPAVNLKGLSSFRNDAFPKAAPDCWLDRPDADRAIARKLESGAITAAEAEVCRSWVRDGYVILEGLIDAAMLDATWEAYERALADGSLGECRFVNEAETLFDRKLDPHLVLPQVRALQHHPAVLRWADVLFGRKTLPFQTIMGHAGSEQAAHSDSIHMTTYPLGYLVATWTAFEDISADSGPLEYYPGSHRLPYLFSREAGIPEAAFREHGYDVYHEHYEPKISALCEEAGLKKETFLAKKGDVLFWHANLVHGGSARTDPDVSRKALVCHYFAEGVVTYHDLSGRLSRLHKDGAYAPLTPG